METASLGTCMPFPRKPMGQLKALLNHVEWPDPFFFHWFAASSWTNHSASQSLSFSICKMEREWFLISPQMAVRRREKRNGYIPVGVIQVLPGIITPSTGQRSEPASESFCRQSRVMLHMVGPVVTPYTSESSEAEVGIMQHARTQPGCLLSLLPAFTSWLFWLLTSLSELIKQDSFVSLDRMVIP